MNAPMSNLELYAVVERRWLECHRLLMAAFKREDRHTPAWREDVANLERETTLLARMLDFLRGAP